MSALMTADEVAAETTIARSTLYDWRSRGIGPRSFRLGGRVVYRRVEVEAWIAAQSAATSRGGES